MGFPDGSVVKNPLANAGDWDSIPGLGSSHREGNGNPFQCSSLGNPMDREACGPWGPKRVRHGLKTNQQQ